MNSEHCYFSRHPELGQFTLIENNVVQFYGWKTSYVFSGIGERNVWLPDTLGETDTQDLTQAVEFLRALDKAQHEISCYLKEEFSHDPVISAWGNTTPDKWVDDLIPFEHGVSFKSYLFDEVATEYGEPGSHETRTINLRIRRNGAISIASFVNGWKDEGFNQSVLASFSSY
jgi:hypothetical protein